MPPNDEDKLAKAIGAAMAEALKNHAGATSESIGAAVQSAIRHTRTDRMGLSPEQIEELEAKPVPLRWRRVACKSEETGATFTVHVVESREHPSGIMKSMENYLHPQGAFTFVSNGGVVPDGFQILKVGMAPPEPSRDGNTIPKQDFESHYLFWRWTEFWQKDLRRMSGKPLPRSLAINDAAFATPWQQGTAKMEAA
jgi:hypothetical protein